MSTPTWNVYLLRCADDTLYAGITTDVERRVAEHNGEHPGGARYTRSRRPVEILASQACSDRAEASRHEYALKRLDRESKWEWATGGLELD